MPKRREEIRKRKYKNKKKIKRKAAKGGGVSFQRDGGLTKIDDSTGLLCPVCHTELKSVLFYNVEVNYCPRCLGMWFDKGGLEMAKDNKDKELRWINIDLWKDITKFRISPGKRLCPVCRMPLYEVYYGDRENLPQAGQITIDVCNVCHGIWLDRAEFKKIIEYLQQRADYEALHHYSKNLFRQFGEVFVGPKTLKEEVLDILVILKILNYKFAAQHPDLSEIILNMPK